MPAESRRPWNPSPEPLVTPKTGSGQGTCNQGIDLYWKLRFPFWLQISDRDSSSSSFSSDHDFLLLWRTGFGALCLLPPATLYHCYQNSPPLQVWFRVGFRLRSDPRRRQCFVIAKQQRTRISYRVLDNGAAFRIKLGLGIGLVLRFYVKVRVR